ncbi:MULTISPECIES: hypothetical protein [unclassified Streptomyces]|uniref:hypothetical protein n=1 Tax=unclassified Streptomyces TaxID=2593676 RepID=UPI002251694C|nr:MULTISPECIES: hypothetical protein [unclassified Streptomyces]MCX4538717.1 hypothetical protein [Streptomyces sp. NBC_01669]WSA05475.1 hypothetical protein OHA79_49125 [Streptomyces sp. NBC_00841]
MSQSLALTTVLYACGLAGWIVIQSLRETPQPRIVAAALGVLEVALVLLAALDVATVATGHRPRDLSVHLAYVGAAVLVVPLTVLIGGAGRKSVGITGAVGCAAAAVVVLRMQMTGAA